MDIQNLVKMANQIGQFFEAWPDQAAATTEVANHLTRFWDPRMRRTLLAHLDANRDSSGLAPLVIASIEHLRPALV